MEHFAYESEDTAEAFYSWLDFAGYGGEYIDSDVTLRMMRQAFTAGMNTGYEIAEQNLTP